MIRDGRTGFAYAGTLDGDAIAEVLAEARDNVEFGTVDEWAGLAEPDGVPMTEQSLWNDALAEFDTDSKIDLAKELEKLTTGVDPRVRVDEANYADGAGEAAVATTTGIRQYGRENGCYVSVSTLADDGDETQTGFGFSVGREPAKLDLERAAREAADRATRLLGATKPPSRAAHGRARPVRDRAVPRDHLVDAQRRGGREGPQHVQRPPRRSHRTCPRHARRRSDRPAARTRRPTSTARVSRRGATCSSTAACCTSSCTRRTRPGGRVRRRPATPCAAGSRASPGVGCLALQLVPGVRDQAALVADVADGVLIQSVSGIHSGVNPISGDFSTGAAGLMIANGELGAPVREFTIASTLQRMLLDIAEVGSDVDWLPMRAAGVSLVIHDVTMSGA